MVRRDIVVIGGSMGAADVLKTILGGLPADYPGSIFIVTHVPVNGVRALGPTLAQVCPLPVGYAEDGEAITPGRVYLAPPDRHLLLLDGVVRLGFGSRENMARPAIDPLFRSAALEFGPRVIAVLLTGKLNDGASGLAAIKRQGGVAVVQDPQTALAPDMPTAALRKAEVDEVVSPDRLARTIAALTGAEVEADPVRPADLVLEVEIALGRRLGSRRLLELADPAPLTCPDCGGVLSEMHEPQLRFRCQTGHAYTGEVLLEAQEDAVEDALRVALRVVEERAELVTRLADESRRSGRNAVARLYEERAVEYEGYAETLRKAAIAMLRVGDVAKSDQSTHVNLSPDL